MEGGGRRWFSIFREGSGYGEWSVGGGRAEEVGLGRGVGVLNVRFRSRY